MRNLNRSQRKRVYGIAFGVVWALLGLLMLGPVERGLMANDRGSYTSYTVFGAARYFFIIHEGVTNTNRPVAGYYRRLHFDPGRFALTAGVVAAYTAVFLVAWHIGVHRRRLAGRCDGCGYPLRTASAVCPECGEPVDHAWYQRQVREGSLLARVSLRVDRWLRLHERRAVAVALLAAWLFVMWVTWGAGSRMTMNGEIHQQSWGVVTWLKYAAGGYDLRPTGLVVAALVTAAVSLAALVAYRVSSRVIRQRCVGCGCDLREHEGESCPVCGTPRAAPPAGATDGSRERG